MDPTPEKLLAEIKAATNLSDTALGKLLGISQPTVHRILHGQSGCSSRALFAILRKHAEVTQAAA
jgi:predicted transcriptional regulator